MAKFARDMVRNHKEPKSKERYRNGVYLASVFFTSVIMLHRVLIMCDLKWYPLFTSNPYRYCRCRPYQGYFTSTLRLFTIVGCKSSSNPMNKGKTLNEYHHQTFDEKAAQDKILSGTKRSMSFVKEIVVSKLKVAGARRYRSIAMTVIIPYALPCNRATRILGAYTDDRPFAIDLVGAVIRQGSFIDKMHDFGWTETGYFDDPVDEVVLAHAIARYHAYVSYFRIHLMYSELVSGFSI